MFILVSNGFWGELAPSIYSFCPHTSQNVPLTLKGEIMSNVCQKWCEFEANENEGNSKSHVDEQSGNTITWIHFNSVQWKEKLVHMCVKYDVHSVATIFSIMSIYVVSVWAKRHVTSSGWCAIIRAPLTSHGCDVSFFMRTSACLQESGCPSRQHFWTNKVSSWQRPQRRVLPTEL